MRENKYKHLTKDDRDEIQECLNHGMTFKAIAQRISKDQTTISKEVKKHIKFFSNSFTTTDEVCIRQKMHKRNMKPLWLNLVRESR